MMPAINEGVEQYWHKVINVWVSPVATVLQLDFVLLITTLSAQQLSQFLNHFTVQQSSLSFINLSIRMLWETGFQCGKPC